MNIEEIEEMKEDVLLTLKKKDIEVLAIFLDFNKRMLKIAWHELRTLSNDLLVIRKKREIRKLRDRINKKIMAMEYYKHFRSHN
jgi:hypothetical protein